MRIQFLVILLFLSCGLQSWSQQAAPPQNDNKQPDIDPLALKVLKAATDPLRDAKSYSFRALVSRENMGTSGQVITLFNLSDVTVQRPDKLHVNFRGVAKKWNSSTTPGSVSSIHRQKSFTPQSRVPKPLTPRWMIWINETCTSPHAISWGAIHMDPLRTIYSPDT